MEIFTRRLHCRLHTQQVSQVCSHPRSHRGSLSRIRRIDHLCNQVSNPRRTPRANLFRILAKDRHGFRRINLLAGRLLILVVYQRCIHHYSRLHSRQSILLRFRQHNRLCCRRRNRIKRHRGSRQGSLPHNLQGILLRNQRANHRPSHMRGCHLVFLLSYRPGSQHVTHLVSRQ